MHRSKSRQRLFTGAKFSIRTTNGCSHLLCNIPLIAVQARRDTLAMRRQRRISLEIGIELRRVPLDLVACTIVAEPTSSRQEFDSVV